MLNDASTKSTFLLTEYSSAYSIYVATIHARIHEALSEFGTVTNIRFLLRGFAEITLPDLASADVAVPKWIILNSMVVPLR